MTAAFDTISLILMACSIGVAMANSDGVRAGDEVCQNLIPLHPGQPQKSLPPYQYRLTQTGRTISGTLASKTSADPIRGFLFQVREVGGDKPIGSFKIDRRSTIAQFLDCGAPKNSITHKYLQRPITEVPVKWTAPANFKGNVQVVGTIVQEGLTYWVKFKSQEFVV